MRKHDYFVFFVKALSFRIVDIDPVIFSRIDIALKYVNVVLIRLALLENWFIDDEVIFILLVEHELTPLAHQLVEELFVWLSHVGVLRVASFMHDYLDDSLEHSFLVLDVSAHLPVAVDLIIQIGLDHLKQGAVLSVDHPCTLVLVETCENQRVV